MNKDNYGKACKEVYIILQSLGDEIICKIPKKVIKFIEENMDKDYWFTIDSSIPIESQDFLEETLGIISLIYRDYICTPKEKEMLILQDKNRIKEAEKLLNEKYNNDNLFNKKVPKKETIYLTKKEDNNILKKIFNKIKNIFFRKEVKK